MVKFTIREISGEELGGLTITIEELPIHGEGETREEAVESLIDAVIEFCEAYSDSLEIRRAMNSEQCKLVSLLLGGVGNRAKISKMIGLK